MTSALPPPAHLSRRRKLLFSTGDLTTSAPLAILSFFQLYFLTDVAGLRPDLAAWAVGISRIWDAINDPLFGLISDRIRSRWGRRRVLLLIGAVPLGLSFMLMWVVPALPPLGLALYYTLIYILFDTAYTAVHVGYNALTPEMTTDYDERSNLNGYRMAFSIGGGLAAIILATVLGWSITDPQQRFLTLGILLGLIAIIPPFIVFSITRERAPAGESMPMTAALRATLGNHPFRLVMGLYLLSWTAVSIVAAVLIYFATYYLRQPDQANFFVLAAQGSAILFIPLVVWLAQRFDKRRAFLLGSGIWAILLLGLAFLNSDQVSLAYVLAALSGFGIATAYVVPWSMIPDIIEHDQVRTGERREGSYYAFAAFFQKLGTGAAIWFMGQALAASGYLTPSPNQPLPQQPDQAVLVIRLFVSLIPAILLALAIACAWRYPISRSAHQHLLEQLAEREA